MRQIGRLAILFSTIVVGASGASAQTATDAAWKTITDRARTEGKAVYYTNAGPAVMTRVKEGFEKSYPGLTLDGLRMTGTALVTRLEQEKKTGADGADMLVFTDTAWFKARVNENLSWFKAPEGPASRAWPARYMVSGLAPILSIEPFVMLYNTNLIKGSISEFRDILRPEFKGKIGAQELTSGTVIAWYDWMEKVAGPDFLQRFAAQAPRLFTSAVPIAQSIAAGEIEITPWAVPSIAGPLIDRGAPMRTVTTRPAFGIGYFGAVLAGAKRPNAVLVFMDYAMSPAGQSAWNGRGETASALPGIQGALDASSINIYDPEPYTPEVMKAYTEKWNKLFKARP